MIIIIKFAMNNKIPTEIFAFPMTISRPWTSGSTRLSVAEGANKENNPKINNVGFCAWWRLQKPRNH